MAAAELPRPGVEIIQEITSTSPTILTPTLVPFVTGVAKEIVSVLTTDGLLNSQAKQGSYLQLPKVISQTSFPSPRNNIAEVNVDEASVKAFISYGGSLKELERDPGESFLTSFNYATRPCIRSASFTTASGLNLSGLILIIAMDVTARLDTSKDVTVTFTGTNPLTPAQVVQQINDAVGDTVASQFIDGTKSRIQIASNKWGSATSVTLRGGASANSVFGFAVTASEYRVEGSGFYAEDQNNNTTLSPWVKWSDGLYLVNGTSTAIPAYADGGAPSANLGIGFLDSTATFTASHIKTGTTFVAGGLDLKVGDKFYADGALPNTSAVVMKVESGRFKLGTLNAKLSTFDAEGKVTNAVYDTSNVNTLFAATPFAPRYSWFMAEGLTVAGSVLASAATLLGSATGSAATPATITAAAAPAGVAPWALAGLTLVFDLIVDGVQQATQTFTFTGGPFADLAAINTAVNGGGLTGITSGNDGTHITFFTNVTGEHQSLTLKGTSTALTALGFTAGDHTATGTDVVFAGLTGKVLKIQLDGGAKTYQVSFSSDSLPDAVAQINDVVGYPVASVGGSDDQLALTSPLKGYASAVTVIDDTTTSATDTLLGFGVGNRTAVGTGRPLPDFYLDNSGNVVLGAEILRLQLTGDPFDPGTADVYIEYSGLRKDVTPSAADPGLLRISDVTTLGTVLAPISQDNPLALGMFFMLLNAPGIECTAMGVDETTAQAPDGTLAAYARVANFLESQEVYAIAPLTDDLTVHQMFKAHVELMSGAEQKGERILLVCPPVPTRALDEVMGSGTNATSTATSNQLVVETSPAAALVAKGLNPLSLTVDDNVYIELAVGGVDRKYNISTVNGSLILLNTTFGGDENEDGFFTTTTLTELVADAEWSVKIRGDLLLIPGSTLPDKDLIAETVAGLSSSYQQRRMYNVFPDKVTATLDGNDVVLPGYYICPGIAGMIAKYPPQQGFTNLPMTGYTGVQGANDTFSTRQLNVMAGGGTYILVQDSAGAPITCRHQLSTNLTSIETRELSITKVVDYVAKFMRTGLRTFIGTFNITQPFLDTLSTVIHGMLGFLVENGIILGGDLNNLIQSKDAPDTVLVDITLDVPFPCNYIRLTLAI